MQNPVQKLEAAASVQDVQRKPDRTGFVRRPLAIAGLSFLLTVTAAYFISIELSVIMVVVMAAAFLCSFVIIFDKNRQKEWRFLLGIVLVFMSLAFLISFLSIEREAKEIEAVRKEGALLTVAVTAAEERDNSVRIVGDVKRADDENIRKISVLFYSYTAFPEVGDEMTCRLLFYDGENTVNNKIRINGKLLEIVDQREDAYPFIKWIDGFKKSIRTALFETMPEREASVALAMVAGDKTEMSVTLQRTLQRAGVSHIVVVSGLHISMLLGILSLLLKRIRSSPLRILLALAFMLAVMVFYGFTPSVIRACVMGGFVFFGDLFLYRSDSATSLAVAAVLILLFDPRAILNISFQLSFACCFAIAVVFSAVGKGLKNWKSRQKKTGRIKRFLFGLVEAFLLSFTINIVTLPILILNGIPFSLVAPLTNPLVVPLVSVSLVLSILTAGFFHLIPLLSNAFGFLASLMVGMIVEVSGFFGNFRYAAMDVNLDILRYWAIFAILVGILYALFLKKRVKIWLAAVLILLPLVGAVTADSIYRADKPEVLLYNGNALFLKDGENTAIIAEKISDQDIAYLSAYLMTRSVDGVDEVLLLDSEADSSEIKEQFPEATILKGERIKRFEIGRIVATIEDGYVIIFCDGKRAVVTAEEGAAVRYADVLLAWKSAKTPPDQRAGAAVYYEDVIPEAYTGLTYGFSEHIELLFTEEEIRVRVR